MTESIFTATNSVLAEQVNIVDELRIIAQDAPKLMPEDRAVLVRAADEFDYAQREFARIYMQLHEREQALAAAQDQIAVMRKRCAALPILYPFSSMGAASTGQMNMRGWTG